MPAGRVGQDVPSGHIRKGSAGAAGTGKARVPGKDLWPTRSERSERPVAGTDEAAQADQAGNGQPAAQALPPVGLRIR
jgi:hypothetical protein